MAKLIDLKRSDKEHDAREVKAPAEPGYPYGLTVHLDHDTLHKLGVKNLPKAGSKVHLHAHAHVKSVSDNQDAGSKPRRSMDLELRKMAIEASQPEHDQDREGNLRGAKAAMDKALDKQEGDGGES